MSLRIGLVTGEYPPMEGGVGAFTQELARELSANGHSIHVITSLAARPDNTKRKFWEPKDPIDIGFAQLHARVNRWWWQAIGVIVDVAIRYDLHIVNVQYQAAAYSMYIPALNFLPWRLRDICKSVVTFHDLRVPYLFPKAGSLRRRVVNHLASSADGVIATNELDFKLLQTLPIEDLKLAQIPIGSNIKVYRPTADEVAVVRRKLGLQNGDCLLGYFGFVNESKGADILVDALSRLDRRYHLVFVGAQTGSSDTENNQLFLRRLRDLIADRNLADRIHWSGFVPDIEVSRYLHAADMMVMPYRDGLSLRRGTLMAIIAHGRPLISSQPSMPVKEVDHRKNVWLTPVDDPVAIKDAIETLRNDESLRSALGENALLLSREFGWAKIAAETEAFYTSILNRND